MDDAVSLVKTSDGGYALAGYTGSFGAGSSDVWVVKAEFFWQPGVEPNLRRCRCRLRL